MRKIKEKYKNLSPLALTIAEGFEEYAAYKRG
jgi:hypothetical protein